MDVKRRRRRRRRVYLGGRGGETSDHCTLPGEKRKGQALTNRVQPIIGWSHWIANQI